MLKSCDDDNDTDIKIQTTIAGSPSKKVKIEKTKISPKEEEEVENSSIKKEKLPLKKEKLNADDKPGTSMKAFFGSFKRTKLDNSEKESKQSPVKKEKSTIKRENSDECEDKVVSLPMKKKRKGGKFNDYTAYFRAEQGPTLHSYLKKFEDNGGSITLNKKKANIVLYQVENFVESITQSRLFYSKSCRHINVKWMLDSINEDLTKPFPDYALEIKK